MYRDKEYQQKQYGDSRNLKQRIDIYQFSSSKESWTHWLFNRYPFKENTRILEIGCGNGSFWKDNQNKIPKGIKLTLSDISEGMVDDAKKNLQNLELDVEFLPFDSNSIPFPDNSFDMVIANHMLYHVSDLDITLSEISRVLQVGGSLCSSTIGKNHFRELENFISMIDSSIDFYPSKVSHNFGLENGEERLRRFFDEITRFDFENQLEVSEVAPLVNYIESISGLESTNYYNLKDKIIEQLEEMINVNGAITISLSTGTFISDKL